jgi:hypothetical protein
MLTARDLIDCVETMSPSDRTTLCALLEPYFFPPQVFLSHAPSSEFRDKLCAAIRKHMASNNAQIMPFPIEYATMEPAQNPGETMAPAAEGAMPWPMVDEDTQQKILRGDYGSFADAKEIVSCNLIITSHKHNPNGSETMKGLLATHPSLTQSPEPLPLGATVQAAKMTWQEFLADEQDGKPIHDVGPSIDRALSDIQAMVAAAEKQTAERDSKTGAQDGQDGDQDRLLAILPRDRKTRARILNAEFDDSAQSEIQKAADEFAERLRGLNAAQAEDWMQTHVRVLTRSRGAMFAEVMGEAIRAHPVFLECSRSAAPKEAGPITMGGYELEATEFEPASVLNVEETDAPAAPSGDSLAGRKVLVPEPLFLKMQDDWDSSKAQDTTLHRLFGRPASPEGVISRETALDGRPILEVLLPPQPPSTLPFRTLVSRDHVELL